MADDYKISFRKLKGAAKDFRYLLNRGHPRTGSLDLIGNTYELDYEQRHLLRRGIFSNAEAQHRKAKLVSLEKVRNCLLGIDGHNVLITVESAFKGKPLIYADDGVVRDIAGVSARYRITETSLLALKAIFEVLKQYEPQDTLLLFDAPIKHSGELASLVRKMLDEYELSGNAQIERYPESRLKAMKLVATSDSDLMNRVESVVDLAGYIVRENLKRKLIRL